MADSCNVFCDRFFVVGPFCFIGLLLPSNSLFDIIVDPRWIVVSGSSFRDMSSACIVNSVFENFNEPLNRF